MIRALLAGAFATSAMAATGQCIVDLGVDACKDFSSAGNFAINNNANDNNQIDFGFDYNINGAIQYVGDKPWPRKDGDANSATASFTDRGCTFTDTSTNGDDTTVTTLATASGSNLWTCPTGGTSTVKCTVDDPATPAVVEPSAPAVRNFVITQTMQSLVSGLDLNGRFTLYFQRVYANPITGTNVELKWIAEEACKVAVDVDFQCTGGNCVEVTTIVCASFAGIKVDNDGEVSIECKVPSSFAVSSTDPATSTNTGVLVSEWANDAAADAGTTAGATASGLTAPATAGDVWPGPNGQLTNNFACNGQASGAQTCTGLFTTAINIPEGGRFTGLLLVEAWVGTDAAGAGSYSYTASKQEIHRARYNLTRASQLAKTFNMPVNVLFYSEADSGAVAATTAAIVAKAGAAFDNANTARPFLAKSEITYGTAVGISQHTHAYLQVVSQVVTDGTPRYDSVAVTEVVHNRAEPATGEDSSQTLDAAESALACQSPVTNGEVATSYSGTDNYPLTHLYCANFMTAAGQLDHDVVPGDNVVISLKWKLVNPNTAAGTGKAKLLQEGATEAQSVEVSLTIQLGGGETTITTAGGSDGSSDPTVTYIIIAVCIVAAGLILAVVVVAFMCLRNRSQEQLVSMSPQKCTVAAVYDISQPKKADAMDV